MFCINCGTNLKDDAKFCINCGQPVKVRPVSQNAQAAAPAAAAAAAQAPQPEPQPAAWEPAPQPAPQPEPQPAAWGPAPQPAPQPAAWEAPAYAYQAGPAQTEIPPVGQGYVPGKNAEEKPKKKGGAGKWILIGVGGALLLAGIILALLLILGKKYTINMNDYVKVKFDGYSTIGEATATFDEEAFREEFKDKLKWKKKDYQTYGEPVDFLLRVYTGKLDKTEKLKNGDTVTYKWKLTEEFPEGIMNAKITAEDLPFNVEGLKEATLFDPFDQIEITAKGYDGYGMISAISGADAYAEKYECIASVVNEDILTSRRLKNGDEITLTIGDAEKVIEYLTRNYGMLPTETTKTFKVEGLQAVGSFDPFEKLKVEFKGFNGEARASVTNESELAASKSLYFNVDPSGSLKNGDEVRIYLDLSDIELDRMVETYGMLPSETEKTYTVAGLEHYAESFEEIGDTLDAMTEFMINELKDEYKSRETYGFYLDDIGYVGYYFMKDDPSDDTDHGNQLYIVIRVDVRSDSGNTLTGFAPCQFENVKIDTEGKVEFDPATYRKKYIRESTLKISSKKYTMEVYAYDTLEAAMEGLPDPESSRNTGLVLDSTNLGGET